MQGLRQPEGLGLLNSAKGVDIASASDMSSRVRRGPGPIEQFMMQEHVWVDWRIDACLRRGAVDVAVFGEIRHELLRHIAMEEKVLLPFARARRGGVPLDLAGPLCAEHRVISQLLIRPPTAANLASLVELLGAHQRLEEGPSGLYAACDELANEEEAGQLVERLRKLPRVVVAA
jgi:hypothetical protein